MSDTRIKVGDIESQEKLTAKLLFKPNGLSYYVNLGNVLDYKRADARQYKMRAVAAHGFRRVNNEQVDTVDEKWEFTLDEISTTASELINLGTAGSGVTQAALVPITLATGALTRTSTTATVATPSAHGYTTGDTIFISGATQPEYNGAFVITVTGSTGFTFAVTGTPASPGTGTIVLRKGYIRVTSATLGRTYFLGKQGISAVQVYKASDQSTVAASGNYTTDLNAGSITIIDTASGISGGDNLEVAFTVAARSFETTTPYNQPLRRGTFLILEENQFSFESLRRNCFPGVLNVIAFPDQSGEFGKYAVRATPTSAPTITWRYSRT